MKTIKRITAAMAALALAGVVAGCAQRPAATLSDEALLDSVERRTFDYFWSGAEPNSGLACERINMDGIYPENDETVVTTGGSGFGILALIAGMERGYVTREQGIERFERIVSFLERADRFHGAWPHWIEGRTGRVKPFGKKDNGGDLVETAFLVQGLLAAPRGGPRTGRSSTSTRSRVTASACGIRASRPVRSSGRTTPSSGWIRAG